MRQKLVTKNLPGVTLQTTSSGVLVCAPLLPQHIQLKTTLIMTLDISLRSRHQVDQAENKDMLLCSSCKALVHMYFANCIGLAVRKVCLRKAREHCGKDAAAHCMVTQAATTAHKNQQSSGWPRTAVGLQKPQSSAKLQRAAVLPAMS